MPVETKLVEYKEGERVLEGVLAFDPSVGGGKPKAAVILFHAWAGRDDFVVGRAKELAKSGYAAFAADIYGKGVLGKHPGENMKLVGPFFQDRSGLLMRRLVAALETVKKLDVVDGTKVAAMGYCFGGMCSLDLARHFTDGTLKAAVSFHGNLNKPPNPGTGDISAKVLVLHGHCDPMVPPAQVVDFETEMEERKADWQVHAYGKTYHGFAMPGTNVPEHGAFYSESADHRSWQTTLDFFKETL